MLTERGHLPVMARLLRRARLSSWLSCRCNLDLVAVVAAGDRSGLLSFLNSKGGGAANSFWKRKRRRARLVGGEGLYFIFYSAERSSNNPLWVIASLITRYNIHNVCERLLEAAQTAQKQAVPDLLTAFSAILNMQHKRFCKKAKKYWEKNKQQSRRSRRSVI